MKRRKLNLKGKILVTTLTIILSVVIYILTGVLGELAVNNIFIQLVVICAWMWLIIGQLGAYMMIWSD